MVNSVESPKLKNRCHSDQMSVADMSAAEIHCRDLCCLNMTVTGAQAEIRSKPCGAVSPASNGDIFLDPKQNCRNRTAHLRWGSSQSSSSKLT